MYTLKSCPISIGSRRPWTPRKVLRPSATSSTVSPSARQTPAAQSALYTLNRAGSLSSTGASPTGVRIRKREPLASPQVSRARMSAWLSIP